MLSLFTFSSTDLPIRHKAAAGPGPAQFGTYLLIHLPLQLHHLVLHADVELLEVLYLACLDAEGLELAPGLEAAPVALQHHGGGPGPAEPHAGQPAPGELLQDGGFVLHQHLQNMGG